MPGNSKRRGAVRKSGTKKGATAGSGGRGKKSLEGRGPTPKASERPHHPAARKAQAAARRAQAQPKRRGSREDRANIVIGRNSVLEALRAGVPATSLETMTGLDSDDRVREITTLAAQAGVPLLQVSRAELERRQLGTHQGVVLHTAPYEYSDPGDLLSSETPLIVALDGVTDPHNLGAAIRSAAAFGADGVVIPERRSAPVGASAWKVSAGALARLPVARAGNLVRALEAYKSAGCFVVGLEAEGATAIGDLELATGPLVIVLGSEGAGLSRLVRETCDLTVSIPIDQATESLNASVAAGIALYEVARKRAVDR